MLRRPRRARRRATRRRRRLGGSRGQRSRGLSFSGGRSELHVGGRLRRRVPRLPVQLQRRRLRAARHRRGGPARADRRERARARGDLRPRRARGRRRDRGAAARRSAATSCATGNGSRSSRGSRSSTGCASSCSGAPGSTTGSRRACWRSPGTTTPPTSATATPRRPRAARARARAELARAPVPPLRSIRRKPPSRRSRRPGREARQQRGIQRETSTCSPDRGVCGDAALATAEARTSSTEAGAATVGICHRTSSASRPYVKLARQREAAERPSPPRCRHHPGVARRMSSDDPDRRPQAELRSA